MFPPPPLPLSPCPSVPALGCLSPCPSRLPGQALSCLRSPWLPACVVPPPPGLAVTRPSVRPCRVCPPPELAVPYPSARAPPQPRGPDCPLARLFPGQCPVPVPSRSPWSITRRGPSPPPHPVPCPPLPAPRPHLLHRVLVPPSQHSPLAPPHSSPIGLSRPRGRGPHPPEGQPSGAAPPPPCGAFPLAALRRPQSAHVGLGGFPARPGRGGGEGVGP